LALVLLLLPAALSQKLRLAALSGFLPVNALARSAAKIPAGDSDTLRTQNDFLRSEVQRLQNEKDALQARLESTSGARTLVKPAEFKLLHADVVLPTDASPWRKSLTLAIGTRGGARKGMLVLYNSHLVGRVVETGPWTSRVLCVTDPAFRVGAVAVPRQTPQGISFEKRHVGVCEGTSGETGRLKWLTGDTPVEVGAFVLTTEDPLNGIPRGLILGRVSKLPTGRGAFPKVDVEPLVNPRGLEHVMLLVPAGTETAGP
jgi:rod shape-determining protein MreC